MKRKIYGDTFYKKRDENTRYSATQILAFLFQFYKFRSAVDIGCGVGTWLSVFSEVTGSNDVYGLDGNYINSEYLQIDHSAFHPANLEKRITLPKKFDLAITLEVAEHLSPDRTISFVEDLVKMSDVILFSAAPPFQGGINHVNEQPVTYWINIFKEYGYLAYDIIRPAFWENEQVLPHYKQNSLVFINKDSDLNEDFGQISSEYIWNIIHPQLYAAKVNALREQYDRLTQRFPVNIYLTIKSFINSILSL